MSGEDSGDLNRKLADMKAEVKRIERDLDRQGQALDRVDAYHDLVMRLIALDKEEGEKRDRKPE